MFELSWHGVTDCFKALRTPKGRQRAAQAVAQASGASDATAAQLLDTAVELDLVFVDRNHRLRLRADVDQPEELLKASTLVRLFRVWQQLGPPDLLSKLPAAEKYFRLLGVESRDLLHTANNLAHHVRGFPVDLSPQPALLLELVRLWSEQAAPASRKALSRDDEAEASSRNGLFNVVDAYTAFHGLLFASGIYPDDEAEAVARFLRSCRILGNRNLLRLAHVQYPFGRNQPYQRFRSNLGYLKALYQPQPFEGLAHAQPIQTTGRRLSSSR